jgi:hypothetical protein
VQYVHAGCRDPGRHDRIVDIWNCIAVAHGTELCHGDPDACRIVHNRAAIFRAEFAGAEFAGSWFAGTAAHRAGGAAHRSQR